MASERLTTTVADPTDQRTLSGHAILAAANCHPDYGAACHLDRQHPVVSIVNKLMLVEALLTDSEAWSTRPPD